MSHWSSVACICIGMQKGILSTTDPASRARVTALATSHVAHHSDYISIVMTANRKVCNKMTIN